MLTARQYSEKYPGQLVKLASKFAKDNGIKEIKPLGTVVGFKPGQKGVIGSSKVAIYPGNHPKQTGLEGYLKIKTQYHAVISNAPDHRLGIYFLSVNCIDLVDEPKPVTAYPHRCELCGSPARKGKNIVVCSKLDCESNQLLLKSVGPIPRFWTTNKEGYILCPHCQIKDNKQTTELDFAPSTSYGQNHKAFICRANSTHNFNHNWKEGQKLVLGGGRGKYIWKNGRLEEYREPKKSAKKELFRKKKVAPF